MIYHLLYPLIKYFFVFNVTRYITFRAGCAFVTSFIFVMLSATLLWARWDNPFIWLMILVMLFLGALGLCDDLAKTRKGKGLGRMEKLAWQVIIGLVLGISLTLIKYSHTTWTFPFFK